MDILQNTIEVKGTGLPSLTAKKLARKGDVCLYQRSDDVYEVFIVKTREEGEVFGRSYSAREIYPGNEDFGYNAWCYNRHGEKLAWKHFNNLVENETRKKS